jgi:hypothetical protein
MALLVFSTTSRPSLCSSAAASATLGVPSTLAGSSLGFGTSTAASSAAG